MTLPLLRGRPRAEGRGTAALDPEPVTVVVSRRLRAGAEDAYAAWAARAVDAASRWPGFLGGSVLEPGRPGQDWHLVYRFDSHARLTAWEESAERARLLTELAPLCVADRAHRVTGLETWFSLPGVTPPAPRWKTALLTLVAVFPLQLLLAVLVAPHLHPLPVRSLVLSASLVVLMTWVVMPQLTRVVRGWLYRS